MMALYKGRNVLQSIIQYFIVNVVVIDPLLCIVTHKYFQSSGHTAEGVYM